MDLNNKLEMKRILNIINNKKIFIIFIILLSIVIGYIYSYNFITPEYKSSSTILLTGEKNSTGVTTESISQSDINLNKSLVSTYTNIIKSKSILGSVINNLGLEMTEDELAKNIQVKYIEDTQLIGITTFNKNPELAKNITDELTKIFGKQIVEIYKIDNVSVIDKAELPIKPYNINHLKDCIKALGVGLFVTTVLIILFYIFDNTIKIEKDIEEFVGLNVLRKCSFKK